MTTFHALSGLQNPQLHIWRDATPNVSSHLAYSVENAGLDADGLFVFRRVLDHRIQEPAHALLRSGDSWEDSIHRKDLPRAVDYEFPPDLWLSEGAKRVLSRSPFSASCDHVRVHLVTADRFRHGKLFAWTPSGHRVVEDPRQEESGAVFDLQLEGAARNWFLFKFIEADGTYETDEANRLWCAQDGDEIWVLPDSPSIRSQRPAQRTLIVRLQQFGEPTMPVMRIWQKTFLRQADVPGTRETGGWVRFEYEAYTEFSYGFLFHNPDLANPWEDEEARRNVHLTADGVAWTVDGNGEHRALGASGVWTLDGDHELFGSEPAPTKRVTLEITGRDPRSPVSTASELDVWINQGRCELHHGLRPDADGRWRFDTYPEIVTSFEFRSGNATERIDRHYLKVSAGAAPVSRFVVLDRADPLPRRPVADLFQDPPFTIRRPGAWVEAGFLHFAVHCPTAASVEVIGEWTDWQSDPVAMRCTEDGAYWWARVQVADVIAATDRNSLHGTLYKFLINQVLEVQDPAADWVENSSPRSASKLVDHSQYSWRSDTWTRPGWEYLTIYQLHPARFARRAGTSGLDAVTRELSDPDGYLRRIKATALLLMPTCEFAGDLGWGYNPSFFYSVESYYGGPDALKRLVDTCHERGFAVLLDVVFNHAGTSDNVLWEVARGSFFDGDTEWGAMINFDHPQVVHFFEQNLSYFMREYRIDGFRFDFTRVIRFGHEWTAHVKQRGSGGGWEFMKRLQAAVRSIDPACLFMAENLPNDWDLTRESGTMDTQWCDDFHDRLVEAARGWDVMGKLADAMKVTHYAGARWFESTNYPESHDEVGNEDHRISRVAGIGQGYRRNKVAAAAALLSRGIPLWFMGAESGEWRQFSKDGDSTLDLDAYERDASAGVLRNWWNRLCELRRGNSRIQGPAPVSVHFAQDRMVAFSRGDGADIFVVLNFGNWSGWRPLAEMNLPDHRYKELLNSTWGDYRVAVEGEDEHGNGGWDAHLDRGSWLHVPDYGVVVLERR